MAAGLTPHGLLRPPPGVRAGGCPPGRPEGPFGPHRYWPSGNAHLLVVGNRGRGEFTEALLGSVSLRCTQHATGPVVVIREGS